MEDKVVEDRYNEYFFSMRVTPTVNKNKYCCSKATKNTFNEETNK